MEEEENKVSAGAQVAGDAAQVAKAAAKGAVTGNVAGAAKGSITGVVKTKTGRKVIGGLALLLALLFFWVWSMLSSLQSVIGGSIQDQATQSQGVDASGTDSSTQSSVMDASGSSGAPWPIIMSIYLAQNSSSSSTDGTNSVATVDGTGAGGSTGGGSIPGLAGCDPWATKVATYLKTQKNSAANKGIGCQRTEADSDHNSGNALDFMITTGTQSEFGHQVAAFLMKNHKELSIKYLIFEQHIWNPSRDKYGMWRPMKDRGDITQNHMDHVHISFQHTGSDGTVSAGIPGTYDFSKNWEVTKADVDAAFGGAGSGGDTGASGAPGQADTAAGSTSNSNPDNPFGIKDGTKDISADDIKDIRKSGDFVGRLFATALAAQPDYHGEDMGAGLKLNTDDEIVVTSSPAERDRIKKAFVDALATLPVNGAEDESWRNTVWENALNLRMGKKPNSSASSCPVPVGATNPANVVDTGTKDAAAAPLTSGKTVTIKNRDGAQEEVNAQQLTNIAIIVKVANSIPGISEDDKKKAALLGVMTAGQESRWQRLANSAVPESLKYPHDAVSNPSESGTHSIGIFQLQAGNYPDSQNDWGSVKDALDVEFSAKEFFGIKVPTPSGRMAPGLISVKGWQSMTPSQAIEAVQKSGVGNYYEGWEDAAAALIKASSGIDVTLSAGAGSCTTQTGSNAVVQGDGKATMPIKKGQYSLGAWWHKYGSWASWHTGQDLPAAVGVPVYAVADGKVTNACRGCTGWAGDEVVIIEHADGSHTLYAHVQNRKVQAGTMVKAGTQVAEVGMKGRTFGPHLHFEHYPKGVEPGMVYSTDDPIVWLKSLGVKP